MNEPLRQRMPRVEDAEHLEFVRSKPCCVCGHPPRSEAAHIRMPNLEIGKPYTGKSQKPDDHYVTPLCSIQPGVRVGCHALQHKTHERKFWETRGLDPFAIAERLWVESSAAERHRFDAPGPPIRKYKKRGAPIKSRGFSKVKRPFPQSRGFNR